VDGRLANLPEGRPCRLMRTLPGSMYVTGDASGTEMTRGSSCSCDRRRARSVCFVVAAFLCKVGLDRNSYVTWSQRACVGQLGEGVWGLGAQDGSRDLVVLALPGVQSFIEESRSTSDVSAASQIYAVLAAVVIGSLRSEDDADLILPDYRVETSLPDRQRVLAPGVPGVPNRIVVSFPAGNGVPAAERAVTAVHDAWHGWLCDGSGRTSNIPETPGFPRLQWACVSAVRGYEARWGQAQRLMAGRRQIRDFPVVPDEQWRQRVLCTLSPRWPAEDRVPPRTPVHEKDLKLSAVGWVKHRWHRMNKQTGSRPQRPSRPRRTARRSFGTLSTTRSAMPCACCVVPSARSRVRHRKRRCPGW
jgi:CRISPR-associated protein